MPMQALAFPAVTTPRQGNDDITIPRRRVAYFDPELGHEVGCRYVMMCPAEDWAEAVEENREYGDTESYCVSAFPGGLVVVLGPYLPTWAPLLHHDRCDLLA